MLRRFVFLALSAFIAGCDGGVFVNGGVVDSQHRPIAGAEIILDREGDSRTFEDTSDRTGCFDIGGTVAPGRYDYKLHVRARGFKEATLGSAYDPNESC
jgi:hypothetical protein